MFTKEGNEEASKISQTIRIIYIFMSRRLNTLPIPLPIFLLIVTETIHLLILCLKKDKPNNTVRPSCIEIRKITCDIRA